MIWWILASIAFAFATLYMVGNFSKKKDKQVNENEDHYPYFTSFSFILLMICRGMNIFQ